MPMRAVVIGCTLTTQRCLDALIRRYGAQFSAEIVTLTAERSRTKARYVDLRPFAAQGIPVHEIEQINAPEAVARIRAAAPEVILEIGWSQRIGSEILAIPPRGTVGIHDAPLPKGQGAASLNWAIINDEPEWGTSLFYLEEDFDTGEVIDQCTYAVDDDDDINTLFDKADVCAVNLVCRWLPRIWDGTAPRSPQDPRKVTRLRRRRPEDGLIDWAQPSRAIYNLVRALKPPYPPAFSDHGGERVFVIEARQDPTPSPGAGLVVAIREDALLIGSGAGCVAIRTVLTEALGAQSGSAFAEARGLGLGDRFGV